ncbi:MAG: AIR synthase-related protein, partial [Pseudomonadota bacterium]|nr:AIR synthase-related protein [Pseudomonadota bacterium]
LGLALRGVARSGIDISDGLIADLGHILERSQVGAEIRISDVPRGDELRRYRDHPLGQQALLAGGDDYELCFTAPPTQSKTIADIGRQLNLPVTTIGRIVAGRELIVRDERGDAINPALKGFDHFHC